MEAPGEDTTGMAVATGAAAHTDIGPEDRPHPQGIAAGGGTGPTRQGGTKVKEPKQKRSVE